MDRNGVLGLLRTAGEVLSRTTVGEGKTEMLWRWKQGTLIEPELLCPYCKTKLRTTGYIWRIQNGRLLGQFKVGRKKSITFDKPEHPHSGTDGWLCKGNASNYLHGFVSLSPYHGMRGEKYYGQWLKEFCQHECRRMYTFYGWDIPAHLKKAKEVKIPLTVDNLK